MLMESSRAVQDAFPKPSMRIPLAIQFAWSLILCIGMFFLPETPRFLIKKGKDQKAIKSLTFLRRLPPVHAALLCEFEEIQGNWEYEKSLGKASYLECFRGIVGKRTITSIVLQRLQQLVGVNFIFDYETSYISQNPNSALPNAFTLQVITEVVNVATTFPVSQHIIAACGVATSQNDSASQAAQFAFVYTYFFFFASMFGPGVWVVTGEIFPLKVRAKCLEFDDCSQLALQLAAPFITPRLEGDYANLGFNVFWILGGFCWIAVVFVYFMIYETKDMTLEQVNELYENVKFAPKSASYHAAFHHLSSVGANGTPLPRPGKDSTDQSTEQNEGY
ncbi:putative transporter [Hortaea werneckii]|nr:putative transporter [Hortaea werneckii]KAI6856078.1 putative transporter [Hortaea werneckii]KAI7087117.1 putative transporter [Hortaea werneckii]KAI7210599.1 putative transporter [Hortaea werneckii]KAI7305431.1 putative transporter [Hortaea werneckii]